MRMHTNENKRLIKEWIVRKEREREKQSKTGDKQK